VDAKDRFRYVSFCGAVNRPGGSCPIISLVGQEPEHWTNLWRDLSTNNAYSGTRKLGLRYFSCSTRNEWRLAGAWQPPRTHL